MQAMIPYRRDGRNDTNPHFESLLCQRDDLELADASTGRQPQGLGSVRKVPALGDASLKTGSECSFTARKLRFPTCFCLACPSPDDFSNNP